jgi:intracellular septation protein
MTALAYPAAMPAATPRLHPLLHALRWIASDLFSTLAFVGLYAVCHSALAATLIAFAAGAGQMLYERVRRRPIDSIQVMSLALVAVFGAASLLTHDGRFIMLKPTLVYAAVGAVMLKRGWMARYVPEVALQRSADVVDAFGYVWAALMFATALLNAGLALGGGRAAWAVFIAVFPIASKAALVLVQYAVTRTVTVRRIHAERARPA